MSRRKKRHDKDGEHGAAEEPYVSRAQRTRAVQAVNKMGLRLAAFRPQLLDQLDLPEELREAIDFCQSLNVRSRRRQQRLVCQLLRAEDHESIGQRVEALDLTRVSQNE